MPASESTLIISVVAVLAPIFGWFGIDIFKRLGVVERQHADLKIRDAEMQKDLQSLNDKTDTHREETKIGLEKINKRIDAHLTMEEGMTQEILELLKKIAADKGMNV